MTAPAAPDSAPSRPAAAPAHKAGMAALTFGALGVVFGDIGTSPLYALQAVFSPENSTIRLDEASVYGVISLIIWSVTIIVSLKYVTFIMRADNDGEGGIMALIALIQRGAGSKAVLVALGIFGAALFYGDGMITPAISVLSAVEGLKVVSPDLEDVVVPITVVIITVLFAIQRFGTATIGRFFGPICALWFATLAAAGVNQIIKEPGILAALSPTYGIAFLFEQPGIAFIALASIVLAVTGAEALYADMGHFGRRPIRRAWFLLVFPALALNYMGQGSLILDSPEAVESPFFLLIPEAVRIPMVVLATGATVIASQAVISGAFSVTRQAVQLGFLPRLTVRHTSHEEVGQVYVPAINWGIFVAVVALVVGFGSSEGLASAYGIAVTGTLVIDTILFFVVVRTLWKKPLWVVALGAAVFLTVDVAFFAANLSKVLSGGWFPLVIAAVVFTVLITWQRGRMIVTANRTEEEGPLRGFVEEIRGMDPPVFRVAGTAIFLNANSETTPLAMRANVEHNHALHVSTVIMSIRTVGVPHVPESDRIQIDDLGYSDDGITHLTATFGFQDEPNVPATLRLAADLDLERPIDTDDCSYFLSRISIVPTDAPGMRMWRKRMFVAISKNAANPVDYFGLPGDRTIVMGAHIDV